MLMCATLWSIGGIFIKLIPWNAFVISGLRGLLAALTLLAYIRIKHYKLIINRSTVLTGFFMGSVCTAFVCANKLTTAANAIVLQFTAPLFIVVFSAIFFKKKIKRNDLVAVLSALLGISLFFFDELEGGQLWGNLIAIMAGVFMAGMYMAVGEAKGEERFSGLFLGQMMTFAIGLPFMFTTSPSLTGLPLLYVAILGVLQIGIPYILYGKAAEYCPPLACSLLGAVEPLLNPVWVMLFYGERPGVFALIGGVIVVASVTLWCAFGNRTKEAENA